MTKKDYELFANEVYQDYCNSKGSEYRRVVELCKRAFAKDNPSFKPEKFEEACYEGKHIRQSIKA